MKNQTVTKICNRCGLEKPLEEFPVGRKVCKDPCYKEIERIRNKKRRPSKRK